MFLFWKIHSQNYRKKIFSYSTRATMSTTTLLPRGWNRTEFMFIGHSIFVECQSQLPHLLPCTIQSYSNRNVRLFDFCSRDMYLSASTTFERHKAFSEYSALLENVSHTSRQSLSLDKEITSEIYKKKNCLQVIAIAGGHF